jgi:LysW-gamma-L-lysine carboxypeptidase
MNYFGEVVKIPMITYGPGDPHLDHTDSERIKISDYIKSIEILKTALKSLQEKKS